MTFDRDASHAFPSYPESLVSMTLSGPLINLDFLVKGFFGVAGDFAGAGQPSWFSRSSTKTPTVSRARHLLNAGARFVGKALTAVPLSAARVFQKRFHALMANLLGRDGVLVMPTMPGNVPLLDQLDASIEARRVCAVRSLCMAVAVREQVRLSLSLPGPTDCEPGLLCLAEQKMQSRPIA